MRVVIDLLLAEKLPGGMLLATRAFLDGLAQVDHTNEYVIITGRPEEYQELAGTSNMHIYPVRLRPQRVLLIQHQLRLPGILRKLQPDLLHTPAFASPLLWRGAFVITVHDLAFLKISDQSSFQARLYWKYALHASVRRARRIIAVSEQTRDELISYWSVNPERIRLIHNTLRPTLRYNDISSEEVQSMRHRYGGLYLLHMGRIMPRKNVERLVQAYNLVAPEHEDLHLVLTGGTGFGSEEVKRQIEESPYRERIHLAGWVPEHDLGPLIAGASMLVFPSKHEGFGLPIVEAMACGTPVVASFEAASVEVGGEAVLRTDCSRVQHLAQAITQVLTNDTLRERMVRLGRVQALRFTDTQANASAVRQTYLEALGKSVHPLPTATHA